MENNDTGKKNIFIYLMVVFFALFFGTGIFLMLSNNKNKAETNEEMTTIKEEKMIIPTEVPTTGEFTLTTSNLKLSLANQINVSLNANSKDNSIVGYDVILYYDTQAFDFVEAKSLLPDFTIYSFKKSNYVTLTSVKSPSATAPTVLGSATSAQPIASLIFKAKTVGKYDLSLRSTQGAEKTKMVTDNTDILVPKLSDLQIEVTQ